MRLVSSTVQAAKLLMCATCNACALEAGEGKTRWLEVDQSAMLWEPKIICHLLLLPSQLLSKPHNVATHITVTHSNQLLSGSF